jgi:copper chaperone NosL
MAAAGLLLLAGACGAFEPGPPAVFLDATACAHCRMLVSDLAFPAAFRTAQGEERVFDEIGCMLEELPQGARVWVKDFETSEWLDGESAIFLRTQSLRTPMGGGIVAFSSRERAETHEGEILTFDRLKGAMR